MRRVFHVRMFRDLTVSEAFLSAFGLSSDNDSFYSMQQTRCSRLVYDMISSECPVFSLHRHRPDKLTWVNMKIRYINGEPGQWDTIPTQVFCPLQRAKTKTTVPNHTLFQSQLRSPVRSKLMVQSGLVSALFTSDIHNELSCSLQPIWRSVL